jgi:hypothetical protein
MIQWTDEIWDEGRVTVVNKVGTHALEMSPEKTFFIGGPPIKHVSMGDM